MIVTIIVEYRQMTHKTIYPLLESGPKKPELMCLKHTPMVMETFDRSTMCPSIRAIMRCPLPPLYKGQQKPNQVFHI